MIASNIHPTSVPPAHSPGCVFYTAFRFDVLSFPETSITERIRRQRHLASALATATVSTTTTATTAPSVPRGRCFAFSKGTHNEETKSSGSRWSCVYDRIGTPRDQKARGLICPPAENSGQRSSSIQKRPATQERQSLVARFFTASSFSGGAFFV